ncbi:MAG: hypothetical protein IKB88_11240 [Clostridia bacterium]|nr:hypothetical protein [Clostridia bacterium]
MLGFLKHLIRFIPALISTAITFVSLFSVNPQRLEADIVSQIERIEALTRSYANGEIASVDEASFYAGDLNADLEAGLRFNELRFIATHNSYQSEATEATKKLYRNLSDVTFGLVPEALGEFKSETLTDQFNNGVRSIEMDIETFDRNGEVSFTCMHSPYLEMTTTCYDFSLAMKEIAMWSDNNPNHLPITVIIEPKSIIVPLEDMKGFSYDYALELDSALRETLGDRLFTPADMLGDYKSFGELRTDNGWCEVKDMLGKVLILLHDCGATQDYIGTDTSLKTQAMFPMLRENDAEKDYASFIISNNPTKFLKTQDYIVCEKNLIVRTRADSYANVSEKKAEDALGCKAHIVSSDYPPRTDNTAESYVLSFGERKTVIRIK